MKEENEMDQQTADRVLADLDRHERQALADALGCGTESGERYHDGMAAGLKLAQEVVLRAQAGYCDPLHDVHADPHSCGLADIEDVEDEDDGWSDVCPVHGEQPVVGERSSYGPDPYAVSRLECGHEVTCYGPGEPNVLV